MLRVILWATLLMGVGAGVGFGIAKFTTPLYEGRATLMAAAAENPATARGDALTMLRQPELFQLAVQQAAKKDTSLGQAKQSFLLPHHEVVVGDGASALEVRVQSPDPNIAADVANAVVSEYNERASKSNLSSAANRRIELAGQTSVAKARVDHLQKAIEKLKQTSHVLDVNTAISQAASYGATLQTQSDQDRTQLESLKKQVADEQSRYDTMNPTVSGAVIEGPNPKLEADTLKLQQLQAQRVDLLGTYLPTSSKVQALDAMISAQQDQIAKENLAKLTTQRKDTQPNPVREQLAKDIAQHQAQIANLTASVAEVDKAQKRQVQAAQGLPADEAQMLDLQRELDLASSKYKSLRASSDDVDLKGTTAQLPLLNTFLTATPPTSPVWPDVNLLLSIGAAIGLVVGVMVGIATNQRAEEFEVQPVALPVGPTGPELPSGTTAPPLPARKGDSLSSMALPQATPAEAYRYMVYSMLSPGEETVKTVLFTGVTNDELCSEAAAQFAIAMSQSGVRTLLADCNLRHQRLTEAFGFKGKSGISDMLSRTMLPTPGSDLILETSHPDLFFMPSGSEDGEGLGSFPNVQISGLVQDLKERADVKVLCCPACAIVADAPRLVRFADHVCLVATKQDRNRGLLHKAHEILKRAGAADVDVLVIDKDESRDSFLG